MNVCNTIRLASLNTDAWLSNTIRLASLNTDAWLSNTIRLASLNTDAWLSKQCGSNTVVELDRRKIKLMRFAM